MNRALTYWKRIEDKVNWYNVGVDNRIETFTRQKKDDSAVQVNDEIGASGHFAVETFTLLSRFELMQLQTI